MGAGPGQTVALLSIGDFSVRIGPQGTNIYLVSSTSGGGTTTNVVAPLQACSNGPFTTGSYDSCPSNPSGLSYPIAVDVSWDEYETSIQVNSDTIRIRVTGPAVTAAPSAAQRAGGLILGNSYAGTMPFLGIITEVVIHNLPLACQTTGTQWSYHQTRGTTTNSPLSIILTWPGPSNCWAQVFRREHGLGPWSPLRVSRTASLVDTNVKSGIMYDYAVQPQIPLDAPEAYPDLEGADNVVAGIDLPPTFDRGNCILLVDQTLTNALSLSLDVLTTNLIADGWSVLRYGVPRHDDSVWTNNPPKIQQIKKILSDAYDGDPLRTKHVFIIGHVAIPYSGYGGLDGHITPSNVSPFTWDHRGAWVADTYYADMDSGLWTDTGANFTNIDNAESSQAPNDGKFDQDSIPSPLELTIGRVDFAKLLAFGTPPQSVTETGLLLRYFAEDAGYRAATNQTPSGIIGWSPNDPNYYPTATNFIGSMQAAMGPKLPSFTWSDFINLGNPIRVGVLSAPGNPNSISGVSGYHTVSALAGNISYSKADFAFFFGSFFGDWNYYQDNWALAVLASADRSLCVFPNSKSDGRELAPLAGSASLGEIIWWNSGYSRTVTTPTDFGCGTAASLLGDPTLRILWSQEPTNFSASRSGGTVTLNWSTVPGSALGAVLEVSAPADAGAWRLLTWPPSVLTTLAYSSPGGANERFRVRWAEKLDLGSSTVTNLTQGILRFVP